MAIDTSGQWWTGTTPDDIDEFIEELVETNRGYVPSRFVHARCSKCEGNTFRIRSDPDQYAARSCVSCGDTVEMLESGDLPKDELNTEVIACPCGDDRSELSVGFALRNDGEVRWVFLGRRCIADGVLGMFADWKISGGPTGSLFDSV